MNRQERRKNKKNVNYNNQEIEKLNVKKTIFVFAGVFLFCLAFYFLTDVLINKGVIGKTNDPVSSDVKIDYYNILVGSIFNQKESEYYVYVLDSDSNDYEYHKAIFNKNKDIKKVYAIDLRNGLNKKYVGNNNIVNDLSELKINNTMLIKIKDHKINEYVTIKEEIKKELEG